MALAHLFRRVLPGRLLAFSFLSLLVAGAGFLAAPPARAQTFSVIHSFTSGFDGDSPVVGLTMDQAGNLYGTTLQGGIYRCYLGCGTVFKLAPHGAGWVFTTLYDFVSERDGQNPMSRVTFGPDGKLYGTTHYGGMGLVAPQGTVFSLHPLATFCRSISCPWVKTTLYSFTQNNGPNDAQLPQGDLAFDRAGNLYGTTVTGGMYGTGFCLEFGCGTVYELSPQNGGWAETLAYQFGADLTFQPMGGVIFDGSGNLYGTTYYGGPANTGAVYELTESGGSWSQTILHSFQDVVEGRNPEAGLVFDSAGNLYGSSAKGASGGGTAFELSPVLGGWAYNPLFSFGPFDNPGTPDGPNAQLTMDAAGNLYGTTYGEGGFGHGSVFKLTYTGGSWVYTSLHDFTGGSDGGSPVSNVTIDSAGNLYGTASQGGLDSANCGGGCGVVWEITP